MANASNLQDSSALPSLRRSMSSPRTLFAIGMTGLTFLAAAIALLILVAILSYVVINGGSRVSLDLFTQLPPVAVIKTGGGFGNALIGTLMTVMIAVLLSVPFGILAAIYLSEFGRETLFSSIVDFLTNVLSGVPSIVVGVFAYGVIVTKTGFSLKLGFSAIAGGVALAVLMLPIVVRTAAEALESVPNDVRQAAIGLGATQFQTVFRIVLPAAIPSITTGVMLAVARAAGETAPLILTTLFGYSWINSLIAPPTPTLSVLVFNFATGPSRNQQQLAWAASLILVALVLITSLLSRLAIRRKV